MQICVQTYAIPSRNVNRNLISTSFEFLNMPEKKFKQFTWSLGFLLLNDEVSLF